MYGDQLDADTGLTECDYAFLKGDEEVFPCWGAALGVVYEYCRNQGYGDFGKPTEKGLKAMKFYEKEHTL